MSPGTFQVKMRRLGNEIMGPNAVPGAKNLRIDEPSLAGARAPRLPSLDALRGLAMLLVVVTHAAVSFGETRVPRLLWTLRDPSRSAVFDAIFWASVSVAMPVFFVLSGFLAAQLVATRGPVEFLKNRARRIGAPFLATAATILPSSLVVWALGWLISGRCRWAQLLRMRFLDPDITNYLVGPAHLWFLEYLILMLAAYGVVRLLRTRRPSSPQDAIGRVLSGALAPFVLAIPTALILWTGHLRIGVDAVFDLRNSFFPDPFRWAHHAWFFVVGIGLYRLRDQLDRFIPHASWRLGLALPAFWIRFQLLRRDLLIPLSGWESVALTVTGAAFAWLSLFGLIGLAQWSCRRPRASLRYVADSSYWIYLTHFPVVGLAQVTLAQVSLDAGSKFLMVLGVTLGVGLGSYQTLVRNTWLGLWLNGTSPGGLGRPRIPSLIGERVPGHAEQPRA
jgi:peptidoglycan/LPS O-acetylase OafA/YrhL